MTKLTNKLGVAKIIAKSEKFADNLNNSEVLIESEMIENNDFSFSDELQKKLDSVNIDHHKNKTISKNSFYKPEYKATFLNDIDGRDCRRKSRNDQKDLSEKLVKSAKNRINPIEHKQNLDNLIAFYNKAMNHCNFTIYTQKNSDTGKGIKDINLAIDIIKESLKIK